MGNLNDRCALAPGFVDQRKQLLDRLEIARVGAIEGFAIAPNIVHRDGLAVLNVNGALQTAWQYRNTSVPA